MEPVTEQRFIRSTTKIPVTLEILANVSFIQVVGAVRTVVIVNALAGYPEDYAISDVIICNYISDRRTSQHNARALSQQDIIFNQAETCS